MATRRTTGKVMEVQKLWLTTAETKSYLGCEERWLSTLRDENKICFSKIKGKYFYELNSLLRLLEKHKVPVIS